MKVFCISDLHLSFSVPNKSMDIFGEKWVEHFEKIAENWNKMVSAEDLVCIAGDISWALKLEDAKKDLEWIDHLPGTKCFIKGNHDYWFSTKSKVQTILPPSIHMIQNNAFHFHDIAVGGSRLWDCDAFNFDALFSNQKKREPNEDNEKIYARELQRLELSLSQMNSQAKCKIVMTHYPPLSSGLQENIVTKLLEKFSIQFCLFGHLHGLDSKQKLFGELNGIDYQLTACDYLDFAPMLVTTL